jgi:hypothetical protein
VDVDSRIFGKQNDITRLSHLFISCTRKREDEQHMSSCTVSFWRNAGPHSLDGGRKPTPKEVLYRRAKCGCPHGLGRWYFWQPPNPHWNGSRSQHTASYEHFGSPFWYLVRNTKSREQGHERPQRTFLIKRRTAVWMTGEKNTDRGFYKYSSSPLFSSTPYMCS